MQPLLLPPHPTYKRYTVRARSLRLFSLCLARYIPSVFCTMYRLHGIGRITARVPNFFLHCMRELHDPCARVRGDADEKWKKRKKQKKCSTRARSGKETGRSNGKEAALYVWRSAACMCIGAFHFVFRHTCLVHLANGIGKPAAHRRIEYIYVYIYIHIHTYIHRCTDRKRAPDTCEKRSDPGERERERVQKERKKIESRWGEYRSPSSPGEIEKKSERERKRERESSTGFDLYLLAIR